MWIGRCKMELYNLYYKAGNKIVERKNITKQEVAEFINSLQAHPESDLRVTKVKGRDEEER